MSSISVTAGTARKPRHRSLFVQVPIDPLPGACWARVAPDFVVGLDIF